MKILVAGGLGFIGYYLSKRLLDEGHTVICLDNAYNGKINKLNKSLFNYFNFTYIHADICKPIAGFTVDQIYNLACPASPNHYNRDPVQTMKINTIGVINLLDFAIKSKARYLQVSTSDVYSKIHDTSYLLESSDVSHINAGYRRTYGPAKLTAESIVDAYVVSKFTQASTVIVRLFSTYGYFPFSMQNDERLIPTWITKALNHEDLIVYGGDQIRSYLYVEDAVDALTLLMNDDYKNIPPTNISSNETISLIDLSKKIIALSDSASDIRKCPELSGDKVNVISDTNYARSKYGWEAKTTLDEGLAKTIELFKKNL